MYCELFKIIKMSNAKIRIVSIAGLAAAFILLLPLIAMQIIDGMDWSLFDFAVAWVLLFSAGLTILLIAGKSKNNSYRAAVGISVMTALIIIWANLAVGIIGSDDNPANWMFVGVLVIGIIGAIVSRLQSSGMSLVLFSMAFANTLVAVIALVAVPNLLNSRLMETLIPNSLFIFLWITAALLFRNASKRRETVNS